MAFEGEGGSAAVANIVADDAEGGDAAEAGGEGDIGGVAIPETEAFIGEEFPGEQGAGIVFTGWGDIAMADEIGGGDAIGGLKPRQQVEEATDLRVGKGFEAVVIQFDADGDRVDVGDISPAAGAGLPGAEIVVEHMVDGAVAADDVVGAHLGADGGEGLQGLRAAVLRRMMDDHEVGFALIEIRSSYPVGGIGNRIRAGGERGLADDLGILPGLGFILFVGGFVGVDPACREQEQEKGKTDSVLHNRCIDSIKGLKIMLLEGR